MERVVLSHVQARLLLAARRQGAEAAAASLDLGLTTARLDLGLDGVTLPGGLRLDWAQLEAIADAESGCFAVADGGAGAAAVRKIQTFSALTNRHYSLYPTQGAPTLLVSGLPMHRIKGTDPYRDTLAKIRAAALTAGRVLDTCTGLGYTAIEAARAAGEVITIELDPAAQEIARLNPWSQALFDHPKIRLIIGDSFEEITRFEDRFFARIVHDPPMFSLAGDLYSAGFYAQAFRILKPGGRMFHYIGDLDSKSGGRVARGAAERLTCAGFSRVVERPEAFGLLAVK